MSLEMWEKVTGNKVPGEIWCRVCRADVNRGDLKSWSGDDQLHFLCPGCDSDLVEPVLGYDYVVEQYFSSDKSD